jgi:5-hydroxyisourate hydrolase
VSYLSAHVLDASIGRPAVGVMVTLEDNTGEIARGVTDSDGRVTELGPERLVSGEYTVTFHTGDYFDQQATASFHPQVSVHFRTDADQPHYHIPLLLSPFAYTTYRGS